MNWFYANDGRQIGPVDEGELDGLVRRGEIIASTLVWRAGLATWQPYAEVRPPGAPIAPAERPLAPPRSGEAKCAECGQIFPADEVVNLAGAEVCAGCKSVYLQKLREGAPLGQRLPYAGFWIRFAAVSLDGLILLPVSLLIWGIVFFHDPQIFTENEGFGVRRLLIQFALMLAGVAYDALFVGRFGATPGKMICNLRIVHPDGSRVSYTRAFGRCGAKWLSGIIFGIGYLMAAFDDEKRALHDQICDTRVIRSP